METDEDVKVKLLFVQEFTYRQWDSYRGPTKMKKEGQRFKSLF